MDSRGEGGYDAVLLTPGETREEGVIVELDCIEECFPVVPVVSLLDSGAPNDSIEAGKLCSQVIICETSSGGRGQMQKPSGICSGS